MRKSFTCRRRSSSTMELNSSGLIYGSILVPIWMNLTLSRKSSTEVETVSTGTSLALMMVAASVSSSPEADGITNRVSTPLYARPLTIP